MQEYIGQDLIWNLLGTNPYQPNHSNFSITFTAHSAAENQEIVCFILKHIPQDKLVKVNRGPVTFVPGGEMINEIIVKNSFGRESTVKIMNLPKEAKPKQKHYCSSCHKQFEPLDNFAYGFSKGNPFYVCFCQECADKLTPEEKDSIIIANSK